MFNQYNKNIKKQSLTQFLKSDIDKQQIELRKKNRSGLNFMNKNYHNKLKNLYDSLSLTDIKKMHIVIIDKYNNKHEFNGDFNMLTYNDDDNSETVSFNIKNDKITFISSVDENEELNDIFFRINNDINDIDFDHFDIYLYV